MHFANTDLKNGGEHRHKTAPTRAHKHIVELFARAGDVMLTRLARALDDFTCNHVKAVA